MKPKHEAWANNSNVSHNHFYLKFDGQIQTVWSPSAYTF